MLTQERLRSLLHYDPETGVFTRKGKRAGAAHHSGYRNILVDGKQYGEHRLAWLYMTGAFPPTVDHLNLIKSDNKFANLREATKSQNQANIGSKHAGLKGTSYDKSRNKYIARCNDKFLGRYSTEQEAHAAYIVASDLLHGEFARAS